MFNITITKPLIANFIIFLLATGIGFFINHSYQPDNTLHKSVLCESVLTVNTCENPTMITQEASMDFDQLSLSGVGIHKKTTVKHKPVRRKTIRKKTASKLCADMDL